MGVTAMLTVLVMVTAMLTVLAMAMTMVMVMAHGNFILDVAILITFGLSRTTSLYPNELLHLAASGGGFAESFKIKEPGKKRSDSLRMANSVTGRLAGQHSNVQMH